MPSGSALDEHRHDRRQQPIHALRQRLHDQISAVAIHDQRRQQIAFTVHEAIRRRVDVRARAEVDRRRESRAPERRIDVLLAACDDAQRDLRRLAIKRPSEKALARPEDVDDIPRLRRNVGHVGAIDPRVSATETFFTAGRDDSCWNHVGTHRLRRLVRVGCFAAFWTRAIGAVGSAAVRLRLLHGGRRAGRPALPRGATPESKSEAKPSGAHEPP